MIINYIISLIGEDNISNLISKNEILGPVISSAIGLIPNCASSVILTELFIENVISMPIMLSGLLVNAGVGILVLFKTNKNLKENMVIVTILYFIGVISGGILQLII